jgi:hypothetical protein
MHAPGSAASQNFVKLAKEIGSLPMDTKQQGSLQFFVERLVSQEPEVANG